MLTRQIDGAMLHYQPADDAQRGQLTDDLDDLFLVALVACLVPVGLARGVPYGGPK